MTDKAIRSAKLTAAGILDKKRAETAVTRAGGQIAPSKFMPNVPRSVHADGGRIGKDYGGALGYVPQYQEQQAPHLAVARAPVQSQQQGPSTMETLTDLISKAQQAPAEAPTEAPSPSAATEGHGGVSASAQAALDALRKGWTGQSFNVISDYRDPAQNDAVGGAKGSQHLSGNAFDIDTHGWTPEQKLALATEARNSGFNGFGFYDNNMHFDVGPARTWGPSYHHDSVPDWARGFASGGRIGKSGGGAMDLRSKAAQVVRDQPQAKGNVDQLLAMMAARGVKPSELLNAGRPFGHSVSKEELAQHFENSVPDVQVQRNDGLRAGSRPTRYNNYTLPGGEKYREHLLHLGDIEDQKQKLKESLYEQWEKAKAAGDTETADQIVSKYYSLGNYDVDPNFQSNHWTIPNVLAHVRMKDRDNGKTLHVEEVQSDWGQKGREKGFYDPAKPIEVFHTGTGKTVHATHGLGEAKRKAEELGPEYDYAYQDEDKVPQGPYVGNTQQWTDLALKHALSEAARGGHDRVVFSPGEANANLYGIDPKGMSEYYKNFVHKGATKLMQQHDPSIQPESYDLPGGYKGYSLPMTDTARQSILKNGFQAFKDGGTVEEPITAYHGSPHSFDKFDISKIGTGEGAQSYGHGLYFAANENIAKGYRDALTDPGNVPLHFDQRPVDTPWNEDIRARWPEHFAGKSQRDQDAMEEALGNLSQVNQMADVPNALNNMSPAAKYMYQRHIRPKLTKPDLGKGHMYKVKLHARPEELLDWDRPIADQHPHVQNAVQQALFDKYGQNAHIGNRRGSDLTHLLQEPDFTDRLRSYGIKGIRYLDAGSRDLTDGDPTHNYVMFHHDPVEVTDKYAYGGKVDVGRALALTRRFTKDGKAATMSLKSKGN